MTDKSEAQKKRERELAAALTPEPKPTKVDIDAANARHGTRIPDLHPEVMFTELGWAVCRGGWIVRLFDGPADAHDWLKPPELAAAEPGD